MGKNKLKKFADMERYNCVLQYPREELLRLGFPYKGKWNGDIFARQRPIVLELGCGRGEYTVGLARRYVDKNFVGIDIKGARMWTGATQALQDGLKNVAFLRTSIEIIDRFFAEDEVQEIWLTFSDPQMKNPRKRLTSTYFMERYRRFLVDGGIVHLKTDSNFLFTYTTYMVDTNHLPLKLRTTNLYAEQSADYAEAAAIQTYYESMWRERGIDIKYQQFCLPHEGVLTEPDVEIEMDEYRSYHRDKRSSKQTAK